MCRMGEHHPPHTLPGGPAAAAVAAFWLLRNRRPGTVLRASPLGGAGPVVPLWCGGDRRCAPPLFQRYPGRPQAAALPGLPAGRPHNTRGRRGRSTLCPLVPTALRAIGNAPASRRSFLAMPPLGASRGCAVLLGVRLWPVGHHARKRRPSGRRFVVPSADRLRARCRYCPAGGRPGTVCPPGCSYGIQGRWPGAYLALDITRSGMVT